MNSLRKLSNGFKALHRDEDGMEAIQVVAIVAVAAIVLIFVKGTIWPRVQSFAMDQLGKLISH